MANLYVDSTYTDATPGWGVTAFADVVTAVAAATTVDGDCIYLADENFSGSVTLAGKQLSFIGAGTASKITGSVIAAASALGTQDIDFSLNSIIVSANVDGSEASGTSTPRTARNVTISLTGCTVLQSGTTTASLAASNSTSARFSGDVVLTVNNSSLSGMITGSAGQVDGNLIVNVANNSDVAGALYGSRKNSAKVATNIALNVDSSRVRGDVYTTYGNKTTVASAGAPGSVAVNVTAGTTGSIYALGGRNTTYTFTSYGNVSVDLEEGSVAAAVNGTYGSVNTIYGNLELDVNDSFIAAVSASGDNKLYQGKVFRGATGTTAVNELSGVEDSGNIRMKLQNSVAGDITGVTGNSSTVVGNVTIELDHSYSGTVTLTPAGELVSVGVLDDIIGSNSNVGGDIGISLTNDSKAGNISGLAGAGESVGGALSISLAGSSAGTITALANTAASVTTTVTGGIALSVSGDSTVSKLFACSTNGVTVDSDLSISVADSRLTSGLTLGLGGSTTTLNGDVTATISGTSSLANVVMGSSDASSTINGDVALTFTGTHSAIGSITKSGTYAEGKTATVTFDGASGTLSSFQGSIDAVYLTNNAQMTLTSGSMQNSYSTITIDAGSKLSVISDGGTQISMVGTISGDGVLAVGANLEKTGSKWVRFFNANVSTDIDVLSSGTLRFYGKSTLSDCNINLAGNMFLDQSNYVADSSIGLNFDLTGMTGENSTELFTNINNFRRATMSVSVNQAQARGTYLLATGAGNVTSALTLKIDESDYAIAINGDAVNVDGAGYFRLCRGEDNNLTLTVKDSALVIDENVDTQNYENASGGSLIVDGALVSGNLFADLADGSELDIRNGVLHQVFSGTKFTAAGTSGTVFTRLTGGTFTRVFAGNAISGGDVSTDAAELEIAGNLDPSAGAAAVWNYGAGIVRGGTSSVGNSGVSVTAGAAGHIIGGGRVEKSGEMNVSSVQIDISGGSVETVAAGSYVNKGGTGEVVDAQLTLNTQATSVFGGGLAIESGSVQVSGTSTVSIGASATVTNAVFGGSYITGSASSFVHASAVNLAANGTNPVDGVYGGDFVTGGSGTVESVTINVASGNLDCCIMGGGYASGGTSEVVSSTITVGSSATLTGDIYLGGYADGGNCTVGTAQVIFDGENPFSGSVFGRGYEQNGGTASVVSTSATLQSYDGTFAGRLRNLDMLTITADSSVTFARAYESELIDITGATTETASHDVFDLASGEDLDISNITVGGAALQEVSDWTGLGFGCLASEGRFAVIQSVDKADFEGYTFYTVIA